MVNTPPPVPTKSRKPHDWKGYEPTPPPAPPAITSGLLSPDRTPSPKRARYSSVPKSGPVNRRLSFTGGNDKKEYNGGTYSVHTGPRGGKFIMVKGEKKYIK